MTAVTDFMTPSAPVRALNGARAMGRTGRKLIGVALMLAAAGLWVAPGADWSTDILLIKLAVSLLCGGAGLAMTQEWKAPRTPEIEIDVVRRELLLVRPGRGSGKVVHACAFADLGRAELRGSTVTLWAQTGELLAEVAPTDRAVLRALVSGLRSAGKL